VKILDLKEDKIIVHPEALAISFIGDLWFRDTSKDKSKAMKDISYVYYISDFNSPYSQYPDAERSGYIKEYVVGKSYKADAKVLLAIDKYKELNTTPGMRMLEAAYIALSKTEKYLKGVDYTIMDDNGKFLYDPDKIVKIISNMPKLQEALNQAKEICLKETSTTTKIRGGGTLGQFE